MSKIFKGVCQNDIKTNCISYRERRQNSSVMGKKVSETSAAIAQKLSESSPEIPANYSFDEVFEIIEAGLGKNASDMFRVNANVTSAIEAAKTAVAAPVESHYRFQDSYEFEDIIKAIKQNQRDNEELRIKHNKLEKAQLIRIPESATNPKEIKLTNSQREEMEEVTSLISEFADNEGVSFTDAVNIVIMAYDEKYDENLENKVAGQGDYILKAIYLNSNFSKFKEIVEEMQEIEE